MKGDLITSPDSTIWPVDTIAVCEVIDSLPEHSGLYNSALFNSCPFLLQDTNSRVLMPAITLPERHAGIERPDDTLTESFLLTLLFLVIFILCRFIGKGPEFLILNIKNILTTDERFYNTNSFFRRFSPIFWFTNLIIITFAIRMYMGHFTEYPISMSDGWIFWKIVIYVASFWIIRHLVLLLIGSVFFTNMQINQWLSGLKLIMTLFSFSLLPLVIFYETGMQLPDVILYCWPVIFWLLPKIVQYTQVLKLFSLKNGGYLYLILYLCALEILPVALFVKGLFLLKYYG